LIQFQPDMVVFVLGTNDAYAQPGTPLSEDVLVAVDSLVAKATDIGAEVVWVGPPALSRASGLEPNHEYLSELSTSSPWFFNSSSLDIPRGPDGLHPTVRGFGGWAGAIWDYLS